MLTFTSLNPTDFTISPHTDFEEYHHTHVIRMLLTEGSIWCNNELKQPLFRNSRSVRYNSGMTSKGSKTVPVDCSRLWSGSFPAQIQAQVWAMSGPQSVTACLGCLLLVSSASNNNNNNNNSMLQRPVHQRFPYHKNRTLGFVVMLCRNATTPPVCFFCLFFLSHYPCLYRKTLLSFTENSPSPPASKANPHPACNNERTSSPWLSQRNTIAVRLWGVWKCWYVKKKKTQMHNSLQIHSISYISCLIHTLQ